MGAVLTGQFWLIFVWAFCICATSVVSFGSLVINGLGFTPLTVGHLSPPPHDSSPLLVLAHNPRHHADVQTVLVGLPGPGLQLIFIWLGVLACKYFPNGRGLIQTVLIIPPLVGVIVLQTLSYDHTWGLVIAYWLGECWSRGPFLDCPRPRFALDCTPAGPGWSRLLARR